MTSSVEAFSECRLNNNENEVNGRQVCMSGMWRMIRLNAMLLIDKWVSEDCRDGTTQAGYSRLAAIAYAASDERLPQTGACRAISVEVTEVKRNFAWKLVLVLNGDDGRSANRPSTSPVHRSSSASPVKSDHHIATLTVKFVTRGRVGCSFFYSLISCVILNQVPDCYRKARRHTEIVDIDWLFV